MRLQSADDGDTGAGTPTDGGDGEEITTPGEEVVEDSIAGERSDSGTEGGGILPALSAASAASDWSARYSARSFPSFPL